jgi:hypothetical protein
VTRFRYFRVGFAALALAAVSSAAARGNSLIIDLSVSHNGTAPSGTTPWLKADFESTTAGTVTLTLSNLMPTAEFTPVWLFNTNATLSHLTIVQTGSSPIHPKATVTKGATTGDASIKAGTFNLEFQWPTANNADRFGGGKTATFTITDSVDKITAASFDVLSTGSQGGFLSAAKVQGIPSGRGTASGTIVNGVNSAAIPEPSSALLGVIGIGLVGSIALAKRRRSRQAV